MMSQTRPTHSWRCLALALGLAMGVAGDAAGQNLFLSSLSTCESSGVVTIRIGFSGMPDEVVGGQFFLLYDETVLDFTSAVPGDAPFTVQLFESVNEAAGTISYAVVAPSGDPGTSAPSFMATLTFNAISDLCTTPLGLVAWDIAHLPPSGVTNDQGQQLAVSFEDLLPFTIDGTDPLITQPADIVVNADAGGCCAQVTVPLLLVTEPCGFGVTNDYTGTFNASGLYCAGTTTVTWTVTDSCGNDSQVMQDVTVNPVNNLNTTVFLAGVTDPVARCITFELWECPGGAPDAVVTEDLAFVGGVFSGTIEVPCGNYTCITARDTRHTLRRTDADGDFAIAGTIYVSDFSTSGTTDDSLIGGNLNDDLFIDILDFGVLTGQFGDSPGADTPCPALTPHADISGDGVVFTSDFSFITTNFLQSSEANCCGAPLIAGGGLPGLDQALTPAMLRQSGPVIQISTAELRRRGLGELVAGDLNQDGWLDILDMVAFLSGQMP